MIYKQFIAIATIYLISFESHASLLFSRLYFCFTVILFPVEKVILFKTETKIPETRKLHEIELSNESQIEK